MCGRCPRWGWLLLIATANLVVWLGLAYAVATLAGDGVNLGMEAYLRQGQATAVTYLGTGQAARTSTAQARAAGLAEPTTLGNPPLDAGEPVSSPSSARPASPSAEPLPGSDLFSAGPQSASPTEPGQAGGEARPSQPAGATRPAQAAGGAQAASASAQVASGRPIVLAEPAFRELMAANSSLEQAGSGRQVRIHYLEETLNQEIAALLAANPGLPYGDVRVHLQPDRVVVSGRVVVLGLDLNAELLGTLLAENCEPRVDVQAVSVGGLLTPRFIKNQASALVFKALDWYPPDAPLCLEQIVVEDGALTVYGYRR